jgi:hypothetical protein
MRKHCLVSKLAFLALLLVPACIDGTAADDDGEALGVEVGAIQSARWPSPCPPGTPAVLAPPPDLHLAFVLDASGVQRYACSGTAAGATWTLVGPAADLFTSGHYVVGTHYAGPTWEYADGSTVVGARVAGATVDPTAIPWLLLEVTSHSGPRGKLTPITAIQRLATFGGTPPATGCDADHLGATANVAYAAKYFFYRTRSGHPSNRRCGEPD